MFLLIPTRKMLHRDDGSIPKTPWNCGHKAHGQLVYQLLRPIEHLLFIFEINLKLTYYMGTVLITFGIIPQPACM